MEISFPKKSLGYTYIPNYSYQELQLKFRREVVLLSSKQMLMVFLLVYWLALPEVWFLA